MVSNRKARLSLAMVINDKIRISNRRWLTFGANFPDCWDHKVKPSASQSRRKNLIREYRIDLHTERGIAAGLHPRTARIKAVMLVDWGA